MKRLITILLPFFILASTYAADDLQIKTSSLTVDGTYKRFYFSTGAGFTPTVTIGDGKTLTFEYQTPFWKDDSDEVESITFTGGTFIHNNNSASTRTCSMGNNIRAINTCISCLSQ